MPLKLDRLRSNIPFGEVRNDKGEVIGMVYPNAAMLRWDEDRCSRIEAQFTAVEAELLRQELEDTITVAQDAADAAQTAADNADAAAAGAQDTADAIAALNSIINGQVSAGTVITGTDAGTTATVSVNAFTFTYGTGATASVSASSVTTLAFSTAYALYYDQPSRAGGAITLVATTNPVTAQPTDTHPDRHYVGSITTPADGAADTFGVANIRALPPEIDIGTPW